MSFWSTSTGEDLSKTETPKEYESAGGDMEPLPEGTTVLAFIKEAKWDKGSEQDGFPRYIKIRWDVEQPESVARRVIFEKYWVLDPNPNAKTSEAATKRSDRDKKNLMFIDSLGGGKLAAKGEMPDDDTLALSLSSIQAVLKLGFYDINGDGKKVGNFVREIHPKGSKELNVPEAETKSGGDLGGDDIPF